jgi:hypothetical protein
MANLRDSTSALSNDRTNLTGNYARSFEGEPSSHKQLHPAFHSEPKLATLKFLRRQKNLPPTHGGEPKTPRIWAFPAKPFRTAFCFFSK